MTFGFAAATLAAERRLVAALGLRPVALAPGLGAAEGVLRDAPVRLETRAYVGPGIGWARFATMTSPSIDVGNALCAPDGERPWPILGADLVSVVPGRGMVAADLSPTGDDADDREAQVAPLARRRAGAPSLPEGGPLPAWCADFFSPHHVYTRVGGDRRDAALAAFDDVIDAFVEVTRATGEARDPAREAPRAATRRAYDAAHRDDDRGLDMLSRAFGAAWARRYVREVLFPGDEPPMRPQTR